MSNTDPNSNLKSGLKAPTKIARPGLGAPASIPKPSIPTSTSKTSNLNTSSTHSISSSSATNTTHTNLVGSTSTANLNPPEDLTESNENLLDFKLNDRVYVNGTKPGVIAFIGETQFKEGVWAGVILESCDGKNNGSIGGVTYFQTEENRGVFCRLNKLSKTEVRDETGSNLNVTQSKPSQEGGDIQLKVGDRVIINNSGGGHKTGVLRYIGTTDFAVGDWAGVELEEKMGKNDGSVAGKRYFQCEPMYGVFAPAKKVQLYTGNETSLVPPTTSSPAVVQSRVGSANSASTARSIKPTIPTKTAPVSGMSRPGSNIAASTTGLNKLKLSKNLSGSQESLQSEKSSIYSTASGVQNKPPMSAQRKSLSTKTSQAMNPPSAGSAAAKKPLVNTAVIQQSLKEKEGHIAQLLKERDFERAEFTRAAQKFEQTESRLAEYKKLLDEKSDEVNRLGQMVGQLNENQTQLTAQCESDKTKIEDLEFQIEEHKLGCVSANTSEETNQHQNNVMITSITATTQEEENMIMKQLELQKEISKNHLEEIKFLKEQTDALNIEVKQLRLGEEVYLKEKQDLTKNLDEIETQLNLAKKEANENVQLKEKIKQIESELENRVKSDDSTISKLKIDLSEFENKLHVAENQKSELEFVYEEAKVKLGELTSKLDTLNKSQNDKQADLEFSLEEHKVLVQDLESRLSTANTEKDELVKKLQSEISQIKDLNEKIEKDKFELENSKNALISDLEKKLEEFNSNMSKSSSDSAQLNDKLNENLREQESQIKSLQTELENLKIEKEKESSDFKHLNEVHAQTTADLKHLQEKQVFAEQQLDESKKSNIDLQTRISEMIQNSGDNSAQLTSLNDNLKEKEKLIETLQSASSNLQQEIQNLKDEKSNIEKSLQHLQTASQETQTTLEAKLKELETQSQEFIKKQDELNSSISNLNNQLIEKDSILKIKDESLVNLKTEIDNLNQKLNESNEKIADLESKLNEFQKQTENLKAELSLSNESNFKVIEALNEDKKTLELRSEELSKNLEILKSQLEAENLKQTGLNAENEAKFEQEKSQLTKEISSLKEQLEGLKNKLDSLTQEKETLLTEKDKLVKEKEDANLNAQNLANQKEKLEQELLATKNDSSATELISQLKQELEETQQKVLKFEEKETQSKEEYESTINNLKEIIQENDEASELRITEINELKSQFEAYENEVKSQREIIEFMEAENEQLKAEIETLGKERPESEETINAPKYKLASEVRPAPRLYCDICDLFDLHETEDCPQQSMQNHQQSKDQEMYKPNLIDPNEQETHSKYNAGKVSNRAYCDLCESFGHEETECPHPAGDQNEMIDAQKQISDEEF